MNVLDNISWKQLGDRVVAVDTNNGDYYTLNDVASTIWLAVSEGKSVDDIVAQIMAEYDITDEAKVRQDIDTQFAQWQEMKLMA
ncbi:MAG: PqqD family protein [Bacteroidaceae bacterium]|nr:PqqD family protein [Bacteroidaceae bacterium]